MQIERKVNKKIKKERIDKILVEQGMVETRNKAQALVISGIVFINNIRIDKPGTLISPLSTIEIRGNSNPYVSRGGLKLVSAIEEFHIPIKDKICLDIGASTGGFTDCLIQHGAKKVYAVDVGYGQLDMKLRNHPKIVNIEKTNARYLSKNDIDDEIELATADVSFISLKHILPIIYNILIPGGILLALVKPQFEVGVEYVAKGGVVKNKEIREKVLDDISNYAENLHFDIKGKMESPIIGPAGNVEYFIYGEKK